MRFSLAQKEYFKASDGAFSVITDREHYDSQLTFTDVEAEVLLKHFGKERIHRGAVRDDPDKAGLNYRLYPEGHYIKLNTNFPKTDKDEIRLYLSKGAGFKPDSGMVWFIFEKDEELWVGSMNQFDWKQIDAFESTQRIDENDLLYQNTIQIEEADSLITTVSSHEVFKRDRNIARKRIRLSNFKCEINNTHDLFVSRFTHKPYLEAHHLVPINAQGLFDRKLDTIDNVFSLCPNCHRAVHYAEEKMARDLIGKLLDRRNILGEYSIDIDDLFFLYSI